MKYSFPFLIISMLIMPSATHACCNESAYALYLTTGEIDHNNLKLSCCENRNLFQRLFFDMTIPIIISYLIGSIPFGLLISKALGMGDIRKIGSGNIGATNVLRTGNKKAAAATLLLDGLKGFFAIFFASYFSNGDLVGAAFIFAILGHCFPVWLGFKGGKGVAVYIGALFGLAWPLGLLGCLIWLTTAVLSRISSVAAIVMVAALPFVTYLLLDRYLFISLLIGAILIIYQHRENLSRIAIGTEPRIGST